VSSRTSENEEQILGYPNKKKKNELIIHIQNAYRK
jgi:hypothetical protein